MARWPFDLKTEGQLAVDAGVWFMPDLANRDKHEKRLEAAMMPVFRRWEREFLAAGQSLTVSISDDEREAIEKVFASVFRQSADALAEQLELPFDESMNATSRTFITYYTGEFCDAIVTNTNRWTQRIERDYIEKEQQQKAIKDFAKTVFGKIKDQVLSAKRAATIAITEVTRMATAGERMIANVWNRIFGRKKPPLEVRETTEQRPEGDTAESVEKLIAKWFTAGDERVCPLCGPLDGVFQYKWPSDAGTGPPRHPKCRCWVEWERVKIDQIPESARVSQ